MLMICVYCNKPIMCYHNDKIKECKGCIYNVVDEEESGGCEPKKQNKTMQIICPDCHTEQLKQKIRRQK